MAIAGQSKQQESALRTHGEGRVYNAEADTGPLHGIGHWFLSDCDRCGRHVYVTEFQASREWREHGEETGTRCSICIWAMKKVFKYREWRPEDSPLFIGHRPAILDARGIQVRPGYVVGPEKQDPLIIQPNAQRRSGTGKVSLPTNRAV